MYLLRATAALIIALAIMTVPIYAADKGGSKRAAAAVEDENPYPRWTGFYVGAHLGYAKATEMVENGTSFSEKEAFFGAGVGYDARVEGTTIVVGLMADISKPNHEGANWAAFGGARAGILMSPTVLMYGLAGYTKNDNDADIYDGGLTLGTGVEAFVTKNTSLKLEYRWVDLGDERISTGSGLQNAAGDVHSLMLGVNFRF